jgi:hypothetical protein
MSITFSPSGHRVDWDTQDDTWLNVANANGVALLEMIGVVNPECYGTIALADIPKFRRNLFEKFAVERKRRAFMVAPFEDNSSGHARMISGGRDDHYLVDRLEKLDKVLDYCQRLGVDFSWD